MGNLKYSTSGEDGRIGEVIEYTVTEDATPLVAGDSSGGVGQINVATRAITTGPVRDRTPAVAGQDIVLQDNVGIDGTPNKGRGVISGKITRASQPGARLNISAETILSRFNVERTARPYYGTVQPSTSISTDRVNLFTNPDRETNLNGIAAVNDEAGGDFVLSRQTDGGFAGDGYASATFTTSNNPAPNGWTGPVGQRLVVPGHVSPAGGQTTHPSIVFSSTAWNGYKYWMAHTPYPASNDAHEDPNVVASNDGITWVIPTGLTNPIDDQPGGTIYNSDVDLVLVGATMYLFWRTLDTTLGSNQEKIYVSTSTNGTTWAAKTLIYQSTMTVRRLLSPSFIFENGKWVCWAIDMVSEPNTLVRMETVSGSTLTPSNWTTPVVNTLDWSSPGKEPWHVEVRKVGNQYVGLMNDATIGASGTNGDLYLITSPDGINWKGSSQTIIPRNFAGEHDQLYRATFLQETEASVTGLRVWYSAWRTTPAVVWNIYRTFVKWNGTFTGGGGVYSTFDVPEANVDYTASGYFRVSRVTQKPVGTPLQRLAVSLRFYNGGGLMIGSTTPSIALPVTEDWTRLSAAGTAPVGTTTARLYVIAQTGTGGSAWTLGDSLESDAVLAEMGGLDEYFSGNTALSATTDEEGRVTNRVSTWNGAVDGSTSTQSLVSVIPEKGYNATQGNYFRYLCSLVDVPNPVVDPEFDAISVAYPGWTGNVYNYLKEFLVAIRAEVAVQNGTVVLAKPRARTIPAECIVQYSTSIDSTMSSQFVQVYDQGTHWGVNELAFRATTEYQVERDGQTYVSITTPHFIDTPNNPECVWNFNEDTLGGDGQYSVLDSQGLMVEPDWWRQQGGRVTVETVPSEPNRLLIRIYGPRADADGYLGPYKLSRQPSQTLPALDITGSGVFIEKKLITLRTGVQPSQTATEFGSVIDNPFFVNRSIAGTRGMDAACQAAGPRVTFNATISNVPEYSGQEFGFIPGCRVRFNDNIFRINQVSYGLDRITVSGEADMTFGDLDDQFSYSFADFERDYGNLTFGQFDALMVGKTFGDFDKMVGGATFEQLDTTYEGATFAQFAAYPALESPPAPLSQTT